MDQIYVVNTALSLLLLCLWLAAITRERATRKMLFTALASLVAVLALGFTGYPVLAFFMAVVIGSVLLLLRKVTKPRTEPLGPPSPRWAWITCKWAGIPTILCWQATIATRWHPFLLLALLGTIALYVSSDALDRPSRRK